MAEHTEITLGDDGRDLEAILAAVDAATRVDDEGDLGRQRATKAAYEAYHDILAAVDAATRVDDEATVQRATKAAYEAYHDILESNGKIGHYEIEVVVRAALAAAGVREALPTADEPSIDAAHIAHQREWSTTTFGPGLRLGVIDHIRKELREVEQDPTDLTEWVDVIILGLDGAWRAGHEPQQIIDAVKDKQARNEARTWPDWRTMDSTRAIEHDR